MHLHKMAIPLFLAVTVHAAKADYVNYSFEQALSSKRAQKILDPSVPLFFGKQETPPIAEKSRPSLQSHSGIGTFLFGRDPDVLCMEAFIDDLASMIEDAKKMGFDAVINIRGRLSNGPDFSDKGFDCDAGRRTSEVQLLGDFALTQEGARRAEETERDPARQSAQKPRKPPSRDAIFLPLEDVLHSAEAQKILGPIKIHWGAKGAPAFSERYGPNDYDGEGSVKELGREGACRKAVFEALASAVDDVKEQGYDGIIRMHSYLNDQLAPNDTDFECEAGSKWASVKFLVTLAKMK
jgi:hypothetical protein